MESLKPGIAQTSIAMFRKGAVLAAPQSAHKIDVGF
jgi:hypothetical protein